MPQLAVVLVLLLSPIPAVAGGPALPEGWRLPNSDELGASWRTGALRNAVVLADFNGDGLSDGAYVAVRSDGSGFGDDARDGGADDDDEV